MTLWARQTITLGNQDTAGNSAEQSGISDSHLWWGML